MSKAASALSRESSIRRTAKHVLFGGLGILAMKFGIFWLTNSTAVLADAMESIVNLIAAIIMLYGVWMMQRPSDDSRPTQHSKSQYMMIGFEGWLILIIGAVIGYIAVNRLFTANSETAPLELEHLELGIWLSAGVALVTTVLAFYVLHKGKKQESQVLIADGKHLIADVVSTLGVVAGLSLVHAHYPERKWIDPVVGLVLAAVVLYTSWRLMWKSVTGLSENYEQETDPTITMTLDDLIKSKTIAGYEDVRYRFNGPHRSVELTALVDPDMSIRDGQSLAKKVEKRLGVAIEDAKVEVNIEPYTGKWPPKIWEELEEAAAKAVAEGTDEVDAADDEDKAKVSAAGGDAGSDTANDDGESGPDDNDGQGEAAATGPANETPPAHVDTTPSPTTAASPADKDDALKPMTNPSEPYELEEDAAPERRFGDDIDDGDRMK